MSGRAADAADCALERILTESRAELVGALARRAGVDLFAAEDALGDAVSAALTAWTKGLPERPLAWLHAVAARRLVDAHRGRIPTEPGDASALADDVPSALDDRLDFCSDDDALRLVFV